MGLRWVKSNGRLERQDALEKALQESREREQSLQLAVDSLTNEYEVLLDRCGAAAIVLDAANLELKQAMEQAPHSPALRRLLSRTRQQQSRLRQLDQQAG